MREVFSDFMRLERRSNGTVRVWLGAEQGNPDLKGICDGQRVLVIYPGELQAEGTVEHEQHGEWVTWYAIVPSWDTIQDISSDA
ncbi:MAG TPA: hypothetical protein VGN32_20270 [Ktedonobacterales bacterium]|jgi:hypothetical protein|nr:hypothetical protein [Ktedonobacterales bacterium]